MDKTSFLLLILFTFTFSLSIPSILSRMLSPESHSPATAILDVSASIQQTLQVISFHKPIEEDQQEDQTTIPTSSSSTSLSLSLHPRSAIIKSQHKDYESLSLARLARDSARVNSLTTKLKLACNNFTLSDLKPIEAAVKPEDLQSPLTSGASQGSGEYFSRVGVGQPSKPFYMVIDTGSDVNWLQCEPCTDCYQQSDPVFNPSDSSTYRPLSCGSPQCSSLDESYCSMDSCLYQVSYGDGSYTVGDFATETVSFGNSGSVRNVAIGCGHDNEGLFVGSAGIIGLGGGSLSLPSQIKANSFSYCLVDRDSSSSSTLEFNSARPGDSILTPLLRNSKVDTFFYIGVTGFSVGGESVPIPQSLFEVDQDGNGGIIVDSGTAVTRLQTEAYNSLRDAFVKKTQHLTRTSGFSLFDTCYDMSSMETASVPTVSIQFSGGKTLSLRPKNYLVPIDSGGTFCFAFAATRGRLSILGNIQQQGTRVSYDLGDKVVGFSPNKC